jgi:hypothetical protein
MNGFQLFWMYTSLFELLWLLEAVRYINWWRWRRTLDLSFWTRMNVYGMCAVLLADVCVFSTWTEVTCDVIDLVCCMAFAVVGPKHARGQWKHTIYVVTLKYEKTLRDSPREHQEHLLHLLVKRGILHEDGTRIIDDDQEPPLWPINWHDDEHEHV